MELPQFHKFSYKKEFLLRLYWEILKRISVLYSSFYLLRLSSLSVNSLVNVRTNGQSYSNIHILHTPIRGEKANLT